MQMRQLEIRYPIANLRKWSHKAAIGLSSIL